ncbi:MAG: Holliday junction branch migration protein RuvA, partial [Planctomycetota bacterium]
MYHHLEGVLVEKCSSYCVLQVGGVGYWVWISEGTFTRLPGLGEKILMYVWLYVREDQLRLFGFLQKAERDFFEL